MSRARKLAIVSRPPVERAEPVPEYVTETREGMDNIADAIRTLAGVMASVAAGTNTKTLGDQRNMAGVIYADAQERFGDVLKKLRGIGSETVGATPSPTAARVPRQRP
jgi:hypothetical protein